MSRVDGDLRRIFRRNLPEIFWTTVENGGATPGTPDSHYARDGATGWIEHKKTDTNKIASLDPLQAAWLDRYSRCGGVCWIAVRHRHDGGPRRGPPIDDLVLAPGSAALEILRHGMAALGPKWHLRWSGGPARWDWGAVRAQLLGVAATGRSRAQGATGRGAAPRAPGRGGRP